MIGQPLQHVADVADDRITLGRDRQPAAITSQQLQSLGTGADQQGDQVDVFVLSGANRWGFGVADGGIVNGPQNRVAMVDLVIEPVLAQTQVQGDGLQHHPTQSVERFVKAVAVLAKTLHFGRPQIVGHLLGIGMSSRQLPTDVPELLQIRVIAVLGRLDLESGVAARATLASQVVAPLDRLRQRKKGLEDAIGLIDQRRIQTMIADSNETELPVGSPSEPAGIDGSSGR